MGVVAAEGCDGWGQSTCDKKYNFWWQQRVVMDGARAHAIKNIILPNMTLLRRNDLPLFQPLFFLYDFSSFLSRVVMTLS